MANFLEELLNIGKETISHADDIAYGALGEQYNKMVRDTDDRHGKFTLWGNETLSDLTTRKKSLLEEEDNFYNIIT